MKLIVRSVVRLVTVAAMVAATVAATTTLPAAAATTSTATTTTSTTVTASPSKVTGSSSPSNTVTFTATVTSNGSAVPNSGTVAFTINSAVLCGSATISAGQATCRVPVYDLGTGDPSVYSPVRVTVTAIYSGDSTFAGSTGTTTVTVEPATIHTGLKIAVTLDGVPTASFIPSVVWSSSPYDTVTFAITMLIDTGSVVPNSGAVTVSTGATVLCKAVPVVKGKAACSVPVDALASTDPTTNTAVNVIATYNGSAPFASSSNAVTLTVLPSPPPFLSVSCPSASDCVAVGVGGITARSTNGGRTWSTWHPPSADTTLNAVSCPSASDCVAVGYVGYVPSNVAAGIATTSTNGGKTWSVPVTTPDAFVFNAVSCPSTSDCVAVGQYYNPNSGITDAGATTTTDGGKTWSAPVVMGDANINAADLPARLNAVSCASTSDCVAVGTVSGLVNGESAVYGIATTTTNGGKTWTALASPPGTRHLHAVSCASTSDCVAVGYNGGLAGTHNPTAGIATTTTNGGKTWSTVVVTPSISTLILNAVSCPSASDCVAVGHDSAGGVSVYTADGGAVWPTDVPTVSVSGTTALNAVSCPSTSDCVAVGHDSGEGVAAYTAGPFDPYPQWSILVPMPFPPSSGLYGVSCPSTSDCVAVGNSANANNAGAFHSIAITSTNGGKTWSAPVAIPGAFVLNAVSCPSTSDCVAVGVDNADTNYGVTTVTTNGGKTWSTPVAMSGVRSLAGVSCASTSDCVAVGFAGSGSNHVGVTTVTTNGGKTWSTPVAVPGVSSLLSVSCSSTTDCVAVGGSVTTVTTDGGKTWSTPVEVGAGPLRGVSCPTTSFCMAVGYEAIATTTDGGRTWTTVGIGGARFHAVSCASTSDCAAVGHVPSGDGAELSAATTDGGRTWVSGVMAFQHDPQSVSCASTSGCVVAGLHITPCDPCYGASAVGFVGHTTHPFAAIPAWAPSSFIAQRYGLTPTTTTVTATPNPALVGQDVTYTTTVTAHGKPVTSGTVSFHAHGASAVSGCAKAAISSHGHAKCDPTYAATGTYPITASYSGTSTLEPSSGSTSEVVEAPTPTPTKTCPSGDTGTYPDCHKPPAKVCPSGDTGTYPNCRAPVVVKMAGFVAEKVPPNTVYPHRLHATVTRNGQPVEGYKVTFRLAADSGLTFDGPPVLVATALTNTAGVAVSPPIRAGSTVGTFVADATATGSSGSASGTVGSLGVIPPAALAVNGYRMVARDGGVFDFGSAKFYGSAANTGPDSDNVVGLAADGTGGYWEASSNGGVIPVGGAPHIGSLACYGCTYHLAAPIVGIVSTPNGGGYWLVGADGGVFAFGDAGFYGSMGGKHLAAPVVGMARTPHGHGYWLVAKDGGVFAFGSAKFYGSMGGKPLNKPVVGMASTANGKGYWLVASDGGIFAFGSAQFHGSLPGLPASEQPGLPVVAMATDGAGGYWEVTSGGDIYSFGSAPFYGSTGSIHLNRPVVGMVATS